MPSKNRIPSSIYIKDDSSVTDSDDTSLGSMVDFDLFVEDHQPKTSGGSEKDSLQSRPIEPKISAEEAQKIRAQQIEQEFFEIAGYDNAQYPVWGELEWESPIELQRIPSMDFPKCPVQNAPTIKDIKPPAQKQPVRNSSSFADFLSQTFKNMDISEKKQSPVTNGSWTQKIFGDSSIGSARNNVGLDIDSSSNHSAKSEKTIKSGNKSPRFAVGSHSSSYLKNIPSPSNLSRVANSNIC